MNPLRHRRVRDSLFLAVMVIASALPYIQGLGFYSDTWAYEAALAARPRQDFWSLLRFTFSLDGACRPGQTFLMTLMYWMHHLNPLPFHLWTVVVDIAAVLLFYLCLSWLELPPLVAVAAPLLWFMLPDYVSDRLWEWSSVDLSMVFFFASAFGAVRLGSAERNRRWPWALLSAAAGLFAILTYEVSTPLLAALPLLTASAARRRSPALGIAGFIREFRPYLAGIGIATIAGCGFKLAVQQRLQFHGLFLHRLGQVLALDFREAIAFNLADYSFGLPLTAARALAHAGAGTLAMTAAFGIAIFTYLWTSFRAHPVPRRRGALWLMAAGAALFALAFAIFAPYPGGFTSLEASDRVCIAAALGPAFLLVGAVTWVCAGMRGRAAGLCACGLLTLFMVSGLTVVEAVASQWVEAAHRQRLILADLRAHVALPPHATLLLDGFCPHVGPGLVFNAAWDARGAVQVSYRDSSLQADVIAPDSFIATNELTTYGGGDEIQYHFDPGLWIYNYSTHALVELNSPRAARDYFTRNDPSGTDHCR